MWSTHEIILALKILNYHFVSPSFKFTFKIIVVFCLRPTQSIHCSFSNIMDMGEPVRSMRHISNCVGGDKDGHEFIRFGDGRQPQIHEFWTYEEETSAISLVNVLLPIILLQFVIGYLCLAGIILMEASSGSALLTY